MPGAALLAPDDAAWTAALARVPHDAYHLPEYVRLDATLSGGAPVAFRYEDAGQHGETVSADLSLTEAQMWHETHRTQINKARRAGVTVTFDDWAAFDEWIGAYFAYGGIMHTHLQATRDGGCGHADKLLYAEVRRWGREHGHHVHHLGGGLGGRADSLFRFQAAFSSGRHAFHTWRLVTDSGAYGKVTGGPVPESLSGHFPPYR
jgi:hypothetical protein